MSGFVSGQPKISVDLGMGFYEPTLSGFDENESMIKTIQNKKFVNYDSIINKFFIFI